MQNVVRFKPFHIKRYKNLYFKKSLEIDLEYDVDEMWYYLWDDFFHGHGEGSTLSEAAQDYFDNLLEMYYDLKKYSGNELGQLVLKWKIWLDENLEVKNERS